MKKPIISINLRPTNYGGYVDLGNSVHASLSGNVNFTTPAVSLVNLLAAVTNVINAIAQWGPSNNRGSHEDLVDLQQKTLILADLLKAEAQYVATTAAITAGQDYTAMKTILLSSGFGLKSEGAPQGVLQMVQDFHHFVSRQLNINEVKLKWSKPLNVTSKSNVKSYKVYRGVTNVFSDATEIASTTKTSYVDVNDSATSQIWSYWIVPVNAAGDGVTSEVVTVTVPAA